MKCIIAQYIDDVIGNVKSGKTGLDIFTPTSSGEEYLAAGVSGAVSAIPLGGFTGSLLWGAAGNVASDWIRGDLHSAKDVVKSASKGAVANGIGYLAKKATAAVKVKKIDKMSRTGKKLYLKEKIYHNAQSCVNKNLREYTSMSFWGRVNFIETKLPLFKSGIHSAIVSTLILLK